MSPLAERNIFYVFKSLWRILRSCTCFSARAICTNQSSICLSLNNCPFSFCLAILVYKSPPWAYSIIMHKHLHQTIIYNKIIILFDGKFFLHSNLCCLVCFQPFWKVGGRTSSLFARYLFSMKDSLYVII